MFAKGINGQITIENGILTIKRKGFLAKAAIGMFKGDKAIPLSSITAVEYRKPTMLTSGYIEFVIMGAVETRTRGIANKESDENAVLFYKKQSADFLKIKEFVESAISQEAIPTKCSNSKADELLKLKELFDSKALTQSEFDDEKHKILSK